jgi:hypothetical protein
MLVAVLVTWLIFREGGGWKGDYTGVDISQGMVAASRQRLKTESILQTDILTETYEQEHSVVACISTLQEKTTSGNQDEYLQMMIKKMLQISNKCIVFDVFSSKFIDYEDPRNLYIDPIPFIESLYQLTNSLICFNHYNQYQMMIILFKNRSDGWK